MKKIWLFFGWLGNEAEVSITSAKNIIKNFDYKKYSLTLIYRHKDGKFYKIKGIDSISKLEKKDEINMDELQKIMDIALLMTHGKYGEDGVLQSILELQKIKYCGCHILSSSLCMDKIIFKRFLSWYKIPQVKYEDFDMFLDSKKSRDAKIARVKKEFTLPIYVKPSNSYWWSW
jgi:D-alanine-D-alanine ligase